MSFYPSNISERFNKPKNVGKCKSKNALATNASFICGSHLRITLQILDKKIIDAKFNVSGCGYLVAASDILLESVVGKELSELHGLEHIERFVEQNLGKFPLEKVHCLKLATETLHNAFNNFRAKQLTEFIGEKVLICTCFGVSEDTIECVILQNNCQNVEEVSDICHAGTGCGSCQPLIQELIDLADSNT